MLSFLCLIKMFNVQYHGFAGSGNLLVSMLFGALCLDRAVFPACGVWGESWGCARSRALQPGPRQGSAHMNILNYKGIKLTHF